MGRALGAQNLLKGTFRPHWAGLRAPFRSSAGRDERRGLGAPGEAGGLSSPPPFDGRGVSGWRRLWTNFPARGVGAQASARNTPVSEARPSDLHSGSSRTPAPQGWPTRPWPIPAAWPADPKRPGLAGSKTAAPRKRGAQQARERLVAASNPPFRLRRRNRLDAPSAGWGAKGGPAGGEGGGVRRSGRHLRSGTRRHLGAPPPPARARGRGRSGLWGAGGAFVSFLAH